MSSWWHLDFSVVGPEARINELKAAVLPELRSVDSALLFHKAEVVHEAAGFVVVEAARNFGGIEAICELVARFPDLTFQGSAWNPGAYDKYWLCEGRDGDTTIQDLVIADCEDRLARPVTRAELEQGITKLGERIARLEAERDLLREHLVRPQEKPGQKSSSDAAGLEPEEAYRVLGLIEEGPPF